MKEPLTKVKWQHAYGGFIPVGEGDRLWLYTDHHGHYAYAKSTEEWRQLTGVHADFRIAIRGVSREVPIPDGFRRIGEGMALDGVERVRQLK